MPFKLQTKTRWWFEIVFMFTPIWGRFSNLTNIFQVGWSHHQKRSRHVFFSGVLTAAHWGSDRQSSGEVVEACSIVTSKWSRGYPPKKMIWLAGKSTMIHHEDAFPIENGDFPMSCYFSGVLGIVAAAKKKQAIITGYTSTNQADMSTSQKVTCQPSTFSVIYIYRYIKLFWGVKVRTEAFGSYATGNPEFSRISPLVPPSWFLANKKTSGDRQGCTPIPTCPYGKSLNKSPA